MLWVWTYMIVEHVQILHNISNMLNRIKCWIDQAKANNYLFFISRIQMKKFGSFIWWAEHERTSTKLSHE